MGHRPGDRDGVRHCHPLDDRNLDLLERPDLDQLPDLYRYADVHQHADLD
jgi:hypothetical protein